MKLIIIINFQITVGHSDYKSIMKILNQNLQEGAKPEDKAAAGLAKTASKATVRPSKMQSKSVAAVIPSKDNVVKKPRTSIKFSFTMDSFVIDLLNTVSTVSRWSV